jgi:two-component system, LytTR family, response regulator LytT
MRLLIAEDEPVIARRLERLSRKILEDRVDTLRVAPSFSSAQSLLAEQPFDVVFLDLNLDGADGMELLRAAVAGSFHTIVVSANVDRAVDAFAHGVLDFVPKPFTEVRLAQALARVKATATLAPFATQLLAVRKLGRIELVRIEDVLFARGAGAYSELVLESGRVELHDKSLERLEAILPPVFARIHKSYLVRMSAIRALHAQEGSHYEAELRTGLRLPVGRQRYKELKEQLLRSGIEQSKDAIS